MHTDVPEWFANLVAQLEESDVRTHCTMAGDGSVWASVYVSEARPPAIFEYGMVVRIAPGEPDIEAIATDLRRMSRDLHRAMGE